MSSRSTNRSRRVHRRNGSSGALRNDDKQDDCSVSSGMQSDSDNFLVDLGGVSPSFQKHKFDFSGIDSGDSEAGELGMLHSPPAIPAGADFNFESELNNILHPSMDDPRSMNQYFDHMHTNHHGHPRAQDGNEKGRKKFNPKQQLAIKTQAWTIAFGKLFPSPKDAFIMILLVVIIIMMLSNNNNSPIDFRKHVMRGGGVSDGSHDEGSIASNPALGYFANVGKINSNLPDRYANLADLVEPFVAGRETPFYWHVPRSSGVTLQDILSHCWGLVEASQIGATGGHDQEATLDVWIHPDGGRYVNVDTTTPNGISRAKERYVGALFHFILAPIHI